MQTTHPSLGAQLAALRTSVPTGPVEGYWAFNSVIAIICAALLRLFTRLEAMVELWQAGLLPNPTPRTSPIIRKSPRASTPRHRPCRTPRRSGTAQALPPKEPVQ